MILFVAIYFIMLNSQPQTRHIAQYQQGINRTVLNGSLEKIPLLCNFPFAADVITADESLSIDIIQLCIRHFKLFIKNIRLILKIQVMSLSFKTWIIILDSFFFYPPTLQIFSNVLIFFSVSTKTYSTYFHNKLYTFISSIVLKKHLLLDLSLIMSKD